VTGPKFGDNDRHYVAPSALSVGLAGRYRIERELGAGGMATVYLAHDERHDRKVAIKVLKPELAAVLGAERFVVEIKTTAALQHPHILPLFDSGTADGFLFYVMPYIQGETIREKLNRETQFGVDEAVRIAREVADALDYAHRHGVIHRDIKPENLLLHDGRAMVMDFGIALAVSAAAGGRMTETGLSLGTPHYMSPEQATAEKEITARSDVYSLASVLYEMLAGQPPHIGGAAQQVIMKIITEQAQPVTALRKSVPLHVAAAVAKSLEKLPADRFESAKAFADALVNPTFSHATMGAVAPSRPASRQRSLVTAIAFASAIVATAALSRWLTARGGESDSAAVHLAFSVSPSQALGSIFGRCVVISPDGKTIVYATTDSTGRGRLFVRRLDDLSQEPIAGTDRGLFPFFSPDGRSIGFLDGHQLKQIALPAGTATTLADFQGIVQGAAWTTAGIVVSIGGSLSMIPSTGGAPVSIVQGDSMPGYWPVTLPDGQTVVFATALSFAAHVGVLNVSTKRATQLDLVGLPVGAIDNDLLFLRGDGALMAVPFDPKGPQVLGAGRVVVAQAQVQRSVTAQPKAAVSRTGSLVYVSGTGLTQAVLVDMQGGTRALPIAPGRLSDVRISPDGQQLVASVVAAERSDVWSYDMASGSSRRQTSDGTTNQRAEWSPDGKRILFRTNRVGSYSTYWWQPADGSGKAEPLAAFKGRDIWEAQLTPDEQTIVFRAGTLGVTDIYYRRLSGDTMTKEVAATRFDETAPRLSPNGIWVAYQTDESGASEVVVRPFPGPGAQYPVSVGGGRTPIWSRDGRRIFYMRGTQMMEATVATSPSFSVTSRKMLFEGDWYLNPAHASFDINPDGTAFALLRNLPGVTEQIVVIHNFRAQLKARASDGPPR
jgi:serine/threonine-protein kinase